MRPAQDQSGIGSGRPGTGLVTTIDDTVCPCLRNRSSTSSSPATVGGVQLDQEAVLAGDPVALADLLGRHGQLRDLGRAGRGAGRSRTNAATGSPSAAGSTSIRKPVITPDRCSRWTRSLTAGADSPDAAAELGHREPRVGVQLAQEPPVGLVELFVEFAGQSSYSPSIPKEITPSASDQPFRSAVRLTRMESCPAESRNLSPPPALPQNQGGVAPSALGAVLLGATFHYLGPSFAVLLFAHVDAARVSPGCGLASAAVVFAVWRRPWTVLRAAAAGRAPHDARPRAWSWRR